MSVLSRQQRLVVAGLGKGEVEEGLAEELEESTPNVKVLVAGLKKGAAE